MTSVTTRFAQIAKPLQPPEDVLVTAEFRE